MHRTLTRSVFMLLALALALVVVACGGGASTSAPAAAPTAAPAAKAAPTEAPKAAAPTEAPKAAAPTEAPKAAATSASGGAAASSGACDVNARVTGPFPGEASALTGAGATFPAPLYTRWFSDYNKLTNVKVNYQGVGSGAGITQFTENTVNFGATDAPMTDAQLKTATDKNGAVLHIPTAFGAVVVTYNIPSLTAPLNLSADTVGGMMLGTITKWNDPKIAAENPGVALPDADVVTVHRSDGSGTTNAFTSWLAAANPEWKSKVGAGTTVNWPAGLGAQGNAGVAGEVKNNPNSIGYVEQIYAEQNKMPMANIKNAAGKFIKPSLESVGAAMASSISSIPDDLRFSIINASGDASYPISTPTWLLVYQQQKDAAIATALTRMMWWAITDGEKINPELGYAPLPEAMRAKVLAKICSVTVNGKPAFPGK
ncbi:MAG: phosphate ABC transporter substrate-binding protein PstS [Anaerolineae bacterium]